MNIPRLPIKKFDENGFYQAVYINNFKEHLKTFHADISHPHKHDFYITVLFTRGSGSHMIDFTTYSIEPYTLFFLRPEQIHNWAFEEEADGWILFHSEEFYTRFATQVELFDWPFYSPKNSNFILHLSPDQSKKIEHNFQEISDEYKGIQTLSFLKIANLITLQYIELARIFNQHYHSAKDSTVSYYDHFKRFTQLLELHFKTEHNPKFYAEKLFLTTKHLHRVCVSNTGKNTTQYIAERIILEAKRMMASDAQTKNEIALQLGFENTNYFHTFFKKNTGLTTKEFSASL